MVLSGLENDIDKFKELLSKKSVNVKLTLDLSKIPAFAKLKSKLKMKS